MTAGSVVAWGVSTGLFKMANDVRDLWVSPSLVLRVVEGLVLWTNGLGQGWTCSPNSDAIQAEYQKF